MTIPLTLAALLLTSASVQSEPPPRLSLLEPAAGMSLTEEASAAPAFQLPVQATAGLLAGGVLGFVGYFGGALGGLLLANDLGAIMPGAVIGAVLGASLSAPLGVWGVSALMGVPGNTGLALLFALAGAVPSVVLALAGPSIQQGPVFVGALVAGAVLTTAAR